MHHGFGQAGCNARLPARASIFDLASGGQHDGRRHRLESGSPYRFHEHEAIHIGHVTIYQHDLEWVSRLFRRSHRSQRFLRGRYGGWDRVAMVEGRSEGVATGPAIVNDQHAQPSHWTAARRRVKAACCDSDGNCEMEGGTDSGSTLQPHSTAHQLDKARRNRRAQPAASIPPYHRWISLCERIEDRLLCLQRNANSGVRNGAVQGGRRGPRFKFQAHSHLACGGELDGVADQVDHHLGQARRIGDDRGRYLGRYKAGQFQPLLISRRGQGLDGPTHLVFQIEFTRLDRQGVGFNPGKAQDVVDDCQQSIR